MDSVLALLLLLHVKHLICDGFLQTKAMVESKGTYGLRLGLLHAGLHGAGTFLVLMSVGVSLVQGAMVALADAVIHYHADYAKENIVRAAGWTTSDKQFWWAQMSDQFVHNATYIAIAAYLMSR